MYKISVTLINKTISSKILSDIKIKYLHLCITLGYSIIN